MRPGLGRSGLAFAFSGAFFVACASAPPLPVVASVPQPASLAATAPASQPMLSAEQMAAKELDALLATVCTLIEQGKFDEAKNKLLSAPAHFADEPRILLALGSIARSEKRTSDARDLGRKILMHDQQNAGAFSLIALTYVDEKKLDVAESFCLAALGHLPKSGEVLATLGYVYYKRGDGQKALLTLQRAAQLEPGNSLIHQNLGFLALSFRDYVLAKTELDRARDLGAVNKEAVAARCYALEGTQAGKEAAECLSELTAKLPATDPDLAAYVFSLGNIYNGGHNSAAALTAFRRYVDLRGADLPADDRVYGLIRMLEKQSTPAKTDPEKATPKPNSRRTVAKVPIA